MLSRLLATASGADRSVRCQLSRLLSSAVFINLLVVDNTSQLSATDTDADVSWFRQIMEKILVRSC
jgi:hypothetical protein